LCDTYYAVASLADPTLPQTSFAGEYTGISLASNPLSCSGRRPSPRRLATPSTPAMPPPCPESPPFFAAVGRSPPQMGWALG
jgi:hypothetical protein